MKNASAWAVLEVQLLRRDQSWYGNNSQKIIMDEEWKINV